MAELIIPELDPRNEEELVERGLIEIFNASNGLLSDFSSSSVSRVLLEGLCFCIAELLFYINQLVYSLALQFFKNAGVEKGEGTRAKAEVEFTLSSVLSSPFFIPSSFEVLSNTGRVFQTLDTFVIPPGSISGITTVEAIEPGIEYNLPPFTITTFQQPLAFLQSVTNPQSALGGTNPETEEDAIARGQRALRIRNITTKGDYELKSEEILGVGSVAIAIGSLAMDKLTREPAAVHVFLMAGNGIPANDAQVNLVVDQLSRESQIGITIYGSPIEVVNVDATVLLEADSNTDYNALAGDIWTAFQDFLEPSRYKVNRVVRINEAEFITRLVSGVSYVHTCTFNENPRDLILDKKYQLPYPRSLKVEISLGNTAPLEIIFTNADLTLLQGPNE